MIHSQVFLTLENQVFSTVPSYLLFLVCFLEWVTQSLHAIVSYTIKCRGFFPGVEFHSISSLDQPMRHWKSNPRQTSRRGHEPPHSGPGPSECPTFNGAHTDQSTGVLEERRIWMGTEDTEGFVDWEGSQSRSMEPESGGMLACLLGSEGMERLECEGPVCSGQRGFVGWRWRRTLNARCL